MKQQELNEIDIENYGYRWDLIKELFHDMPSDLDPSIVNERLNSMWNRFGPEGPNDKWLIYIKRTVGRLSDEISSQQQMKKFILSKIDLL